MYYIHTRDGWVAEGDLLGVKQGWMVGTKIALGAKVAISLTCFWDTRWRMHTFDAWGGM